MVKKTVIPYVGLAIGLAGVLLASSFSGTLFHIVESHAEGHMLLPLLLACVLFILGGIAHYVTLPNKIPSFVAAIFLGMAANTLLAPLVHEGHALMALVSAAVAYILFSGGLETKWEDFTKLFWKISSLSFLGLFVTAVLFSLAVFGLGQLLGFPVTLVTAVLLGAVLASTDPAALIPVLKGVRLRASKKGLKDIAIAESAMTDVTGTLLTFAFVTLIGQQIPFASIVSAYGQVFTADTAWFLATQIFWGTVVGGLGYLLLDALHVRKGAEPGVMHAKIRGALRRHKVVESAEDDYEADTSFFFAIPLLAFVAALLLGGSGYLAAFVVGLMLGALHHLHHTEVFFSRTVEAFLKPTIFILLGAMVNIQELIAYAPIGIIAALVFMFVIRPFAVFLSLSPWLWSKDMEKNDLLFLSFVRETGAIPAALLITLAGSGIGEPALVAVGMWVILGTLVLQPPLTPYVAHRLGITEA